MRSSPALAAVGAIIALAAPLAPPAAAQPPLPLTYTPDAPRVDRPIVVSVRGVPAGRRLRVTIRQQATGSCTAVASALAKPRRGRSTRTAKLTPRAPAGAPEWCAGPGQAEAQVFDKHGKPTGAKYVLPLRIGYGPDDPRFGLPVKISVLDGSSITTATGPLSVAGTLNGMIFGQVHLQSGTSVDAVTGSLAVAAGAPCTTIDVTSAGGALTAFTLNADGVVFATMHLDLHGCGGPAALWLAGKVGDQGLNDLKMDSFPGAPSGHLEVKLDLSGQ